MILVGIHYCPETSSLGCGHLIFGDRPPRPTLRKKGGNVFSRTQIHHVSSIRFKLLSISQRNLIQTGLPNRRPYIICLLDISDSHETTTHQNKRTLSKQEHLSGHFHNGQRGRNYNSRNCGVSLSPSCCTCCMFLNCFDNHVVGTYVA